MTTKFLIALATTVALAGPAHADTLPLADPLVGHWCRIKDGVYKRGDWSCKDNLLITQNDYSYGGDRDNHACRFTNITHLKSGGYLIKSICVGDADDKIELRIVGDTLRFREFNIFMEECAVVSDNMSDGFLNLRAGPTTTHPVKARLVTGDKLKVDGKESENGRWIKVSVPRLANIKGWVHDDHIKSCSPGDEEKGEALICGPEQGSCRTYRPPSGMRFIPGLPKPE
jgi:hypothetical protein